MRASTCLYTILHDFVVSKGLQWPTKTSLAPPKEEQFGDMATNLALLLTKQARKPPRDLAADLAAVLEKDPAVKEVAIAGPGFINIFLQPAFWQQTILDIQNAGSAYGTKTHSEDTRYPGGEKILVEYVSANPTGPLHIGHARGAAIGDCLTRILRAVGNEVHTEYYLNDAGRQMRILGESVRVHVQRLAGHDIPDPPDFYKGDYIADIARTLIEKQGSAFADEADEETVMQCCTGEALDILLQGIRQDLKDFDAQHQVWFSEKSLVDSGAVSTTLHRLQQAGLAYEHDGALWFKSTDFGDDKDRVLKKSDGTLTYLASDIAYHDDKFSRGFDLLIDVWGADHHGYIPRMHAAVQALGKKPEQLHIVLVQLVNLLRDGKQVAMSTRAGEFETLAGVTRETGTDAARFMFLSRKSDSPLDFDLELVKQKTMENPVYYVQYAHARICSLYKKAEEQGIPVPAPGIHLPAAHAALLNTTEDLRLLKKLDQYPDTVALAARTFGPHHITAYLQELAAALHRYYHTHRILDNPSSELIQARLCLLAATAQVLRNALTLLGVSAPESM